LDSSTPIRTIPDHATDDERPRVLLIRLADHTYALPIALVREVIRARPLTPIPGAPRVALGLMNVRGMVCTVLDLAELLRDGSSRDEAGEWRDDSASIARADAPASVVLLEHRGRAVGVAVDVVLGVYPVDGDGTPLERDGVVARDRHVQVGDDRIPLLDPEALLTRVMLSSEDGR
jgi:chemotaxis signal transduction protein